MVVEQLEQGSTEVKNAYSRVVTYEGNKSAQSVINQVFCECDRKWRGIGEFPDSGWCLLPEYRQFDAEARFEIGHIKTQESPVCIAGKILQGLYKPQDCPAYGEACTPEHPLGATMVSSEGACAAYYHYARIER